MTRQIPLTLPQLLAHAKRLGARFRISGATVQAAGLSNLPPEIRYGITADPTALWEHLGGAAADQPSLALAEQLGINILLAETKAEAKAAIRDLIRQLRNKPAWLGLDIETMPTPGFGTKAWIKITTKGMPYKCQNKKKDDDRSALNPYTGRIALLQLSADGETAYLFRGEALDLVARSRWLRRQHLVVHNLPFELSFLSQYSPEYLCPDEMRRVGRMECTQQAAGLLLGVYRRGLDDVCEAYLNIKLPKDLQTSDWSAETLSDGQLAYAALDAIVARRVWPLLAKELISKDRVAPYKLQRSVIPAVTDMELRGLCLDRDEHARQVKEWSLQLAEARQAFLTVAGHAPPRKPAEVRGWLTSVLSPDELQKWWRTKTEQLSTASGHLKRLTVDAAGKADEASPRAAQARALMNVLAAEKLLECFGPALIEQLNPVIGRLHTHYQLAGTKAGRFSANKPNLQQLPSRKAVEFRKCIVAGPGNKFVGCDWNQVELRAAAWISGDVELTRVYEEGRDLHAENAAIFARVPVEQVTKEQRKAAKAVSFGSVYGIGPTSLAQNAFVDYGIIMSVEEAGNLLDAFFRRFPRLAQWRNEHANLVRAQGLVRIGCGRVVEASWEQSAENPFGGISFPQCCNLPVQGICADAMLRAIRLVHQRFLAAQITGGLVATIHDELLCEVAEEDAERAREILEQAMIDAFVATFPGAPTNGVAKAVIGNNWAELK
jgi:DNA polymerase I